MLNFIFLKSVQYINNLNNCPKQATLAYYWWGQTGYTWALLHKKTLISISIIQLNGVQFLIYFELDKSSLNSNWIKHYNKDIVASRPFHWIRFGYAYRLCVISIIPSFPCSVRLWPRILKMLHFLWSIARPSESSSLKVSNWMMVSGLWISESQGQVFSKMVDLFFIDFTGLSYFSFQFLTTETCVSFSLKKFCFSVGTYLTIDSCHPL